MDGAGKVWFGVYNGGDVTLGHRPRLNDGDWHMAVGNDGATGMRLYIDGALVAASNTQHGWPRRPPAWWRAGCGNLAGWGGVVDRRQLPGHALDHGPANRPFLGSLGRVTVFNVELDRRQHLSSCTGSADP